MHAEFAGIKANDEVLVVTTYTTSNNKNIDAFLDADHRLSSGLLGKANKKIFYQLILMCILI